MVDTVTVSKIFDGRRHCVFEFTNISDGTGESSVKKIDMDDLVGDNGYLTGGTRPKSLTLIEAAWDVSGFSYVTANWDRQASDKLIAVMTGNNSVNYDCVGGKVDPGRGLDGTGDVLITTSGGSSGSSYRITMMFRKKYS